MILITGGNTAEDLKTFSFTITPIKRSCKKNCLLQKQKEIMTGVKNKHFSICGYQPFISRKIIIWY